MNPIGQRIKQLRKKHQLTQNDIADFIGVQRVSVSKWESQNDMHNTPKGEHLFKLCQILKTTAEFLLYGQTQYNPQPFKNQTTERIQDNIGTYLKKVPLLSWSEVKNNKSLLTKNFKTNEVIFSHQEISNQTFALPVVGDSMTSSSGAFSFPEGVIILFDHIYSGEYYDDMFIIANVNQEIKFRQVKFDGSKIYLNPLNPQYPKIFKPFKMIGKVVEMQMKLP